MSRADSLSFAESFVRQWARDEAKRFGESVGVRLCPGEQVFIVGSNAPGSDRPEIRVPFEADPENQVRSLAAAVETLVETRSAKAAS